MCMRMYICDISYNDCYTSTRHNQIIQLEISYMLAAVSKRSQLSLDSTGKRSTEL